MQISVNAHSKFQSFFPDYVTSRPTFFMRNFWNSTTQSLRGSVFLGPKTEGGPGLSCSILLCLHALLFHYSMLRVQVRLMELQLQLLSMKFLVSWFFRAQTVFALQSRLGKDIHSS